MSSSNRSSTSASCRSWHCLTSLQVFPLLSEVLLWFNTDLFEQTWRRYLQSSHALLAYAGCRLLLHALQRLQQLSGFLDLSNSAWSEFGGRSLALAMIARCRRAVAQHARLLIPIILEPSCDRVSLAALETAARCLLFALPSSPDPPAPSVAAPALDASPRRTCTLPSIPEATLRAATASAAAAQMPEPVPNQSVLASPDCQALAECLLGRLAHITLRAHPDASTMFPWWRLENRDMDSESEPDESQLETLQRCADALQFVHEGAHGATMKRPLGQSGTTPQAFEQQILQSVADLMPALMRECCTREAYAAFLLPSLLCFIRHYDDVRILRPSVDAVVAFCENALSVLVVPIEQVRRPATDQAPGSPGASIAAPWHGRPSAILLGRCADGIITTVAAVLQERRPDAITTRRLLEIAAAIVAATRSAMHLLTLLHAVAARVARENLRSLKNLTRPATASQFDLPNHFGGVDRTILEDDESPSDEEDSLDGEGVLDRLNTSGGLSANSTGLRSGASDLSNDESSDWDSEDGESADADTLLQTLAAFLGCMYALFPEAVEKQRRSSLRLGPARRVRPMSTMMSVGSEGPSGSDSGPTSPVLGMTSSLVSPVRLSMRGRRSTSIDEHSTSWSTSSARERAGGSGGGGGGMSVGLSEADAVFQGTVSEESSPLVSASPSVPLRMTRGAYRSFTRAVGMMGKSDQTIVNWLMSRYGGGVSGESAGDLPYSESADGSDVRIVEGDLP
jgi:hypothetical protein